MWRILTTLAITIFALLVGAQASKAEITYPWCGQYARDGRNCGFSTYDQCRAAISGNGGYCIENPMSARARKSARYPPGPITVSLLPVSFLKNADLLGTLGIAAELATKAAVSATQRQEP
jgi:hypothetical protein